MFNKFKLTKRNKPDVPTISKMENTKGGFNYVITIRSAISSPDNFASACDIINTAKEKDTINIVINTPGGYVVSGLTIVSAMQNSKATITTTAVGLVASCGFVIWSYGHNLKMSKFAKLMCHASSGGFMGKTRDQRDNAIAQELRMKELIRPAIDKKIITEEQFNKAFDDKADIYINAKDLEEAGVEFTYA